MNAITEIRPASVVTSGRLSATETIDHARAVQEVMQTLMKEGEHYGKIPGTDKPTLLKPGAEKLCVAFRIADDYRVEDLSAGDCIRYRVTCVGRHQLTGIDLGTGVGEGSTNEERYKWRRAVCDEEFEATPESQRRIKYGRKSGGYFTTKQVRTEPADLANTVLKMACKRAKMAMVLSVTGASAIFSQDLEALDDLLREHLAGDDKQAFIETQRREWGDKAKACKTEDELKRVIKTAVAHFQQVRDRDGYAAFSALVQQHGASIKAGKGGADA